MQSVSDSTAPLASGGHCLPGLIDCFGLDYYLFQYGPYHHPPEQVGKADHFLSNAHRCIPAFRIALFIDDCLGDRRPDYLIRLCLHRPRDKTFKWQTLGSN